jgi:hypothetical protein
LQVEVAVKGALFLSALGLLKGVINVGNFSSCNSSSICHAMREQQQQQVAAIVVMVVGVQQSQRDEQQVSSIQQQQQQDYGW